MGPPSGPIVLAAAPIAPEPESGGVWMTLLPVLGSLGIVAFAFVVRSVIYLVVATLMVVAMVGGTLGMRLVQRRRETERRHHLRRQYLAHAAEAEARAKAAALMQRDGLVGLYPDTPGVLTAARDHGALWERRPAHADFGHVRLGLGPVPAAAPVQIGTESGPLATPEPELVRVAHRLVTATRVVPEAPVVLPLRSLSSIAVVGDPPAARALVGSWVASLAAFHAPTDLRIVGRVPRYAARAWEWVKWLPHTRDPLAGEGFGRAERAVTTDVVRFAELVEVVAAPRLGQARRAAEPGARAPAGTGSGKVAEHVVVLVDAYEPDADVAAVKHLDILLERGADLAVTVIALVDDPAKVPSICGARVELAPDGTATYREAGPDGRADLEVSVDQLDRAAAEQLARWLAPLRLTGTDAGADLIDTVRLVDLLGLEHAGQVTPWQWPTVRDLAPGPSEASRSWEAAPARDPAELLRTPIGIGTDGSPLVLDLKDLAAGGMGPHGILVGATGSGKSELLRSLVTGLAARHDPRLVNFVLVDFKGGAAFAELADLPHTVGLITNLADEPTLVDRMQAALRGELVRRQQLLRDAGNLDSIRDYHAAQAASGLPTDLPDLPYLLVIVDEFGELLAAKPEFIDTFVAIGRLGRSMGIHLLLATQRLDEGRIRGLESHLRYRLCLRTFSASESQAVLGSAAAHELPPLPGLGWLRVDTALTRFKGAICSLPYRPPSRTDPNPATAQPFALDLAAPRQDLEVTVAEPGAGRASELQVIVDTLATARVPPPHQVWRPPLPDVLALDQLEVPRGGLRPVVGLLDEPDRQRQGPLVLELDGAGGHVALVGGPRTGKSTFLRTLVHALTSDRSPDEVQVYAVDLGGGSLFDLADLPHVGAVCGRHEPDAIARLLREVRAVVDERATAFRVTGVTTLTGLRASQRRAELLPDPLAAETFLLIDNVGLLRTEFTDLELGLPELAATSLQFGVHLVLTAGRWLDIRPALLDTIGTRLELRLNDPVDSQFGRAAATTLPEDRPGRGLIRARRQFQLALPWRPGDVAVIDGRAAVDHAASQARARWPGRRAPQVRPLPLQVTEADVPDLAAAAGRRVPPASGFLLGVEEFRLAPVHLDLLAPGAHLLIYGDDQSGRSTMLRRAIDHLAGSNPDLVRLHIVDLRRALGAYAGAPHVDHYAFAGSLIQETADDLLKLLLDRLPGPDLRRTVLLEGSWWTGPEHVLVVDDYDLTLTGVDGPLGTLANALGHARDLGFHVLLSRRVAGAQRTGFEPFGQRLRELGPPTLLLNGDKGEGPLAGDRTAGPQPPGRGLLVRRGRRDALVQCCLPTRRPPRGAER